MSLENKIVALANAIGTDVRDLREGKVGKVDGKGLSDENYTLIEKTKLAGVEPAATANRDDSENADKEHTHTTEQVVGLDTALGSKASKTELTDGLALKVDTVTGKGLSDTNFTQDEKTKLIGIDTGATKNRADTLNADKEHAHTTAQVTGLDAALDSKVDKVAGKGLSDTNFTQAEKTKLSSLESSKFIGLFVSDSELPAIGSAGDYANVDGGVGSDVYRVIWDSSDNKWVRVKGVTGELTPAQIKQQYESNPDTNAFTDAEKAKLASVANNATANRDDSENADKLHTHTVGQVDGLDAALESKASKTELTGGLALKVDKEDGKGLSDTNFTQVEKDKLASVGDTSRNFVSDYLLARG